MRRSGEEGEEFEYHFEKREPERSIFRDSGPWLRGPLLGKGGFGSVHMAVLTDECLKAPRFKGFPTTGTVMAVKSTKTSKSKELVMEQMLYGQLHDELTPCPFIIQCFGSDVTECTTGPSRSLLFNLFLEYASEGSLADLIKQSDIMGLPETQVRQHTRSILQALKCIHSKGFVHCDIKPENVLIVKDHNHVVAKVADLGLAKRATTDPQCSTTTTVIRGTLLFFSPECVIHGIQEQPSDIWALGCVVFEMLTGKSPWDTTLTRHDIKRQIATESPVFPTGIFSKEAEDFLTECFNRNPNERYTADVLLTHPFVCTSRITHHHQTSQNITTIDHDDWISQEESQFSSLSSISE